MWALNKINLSSSVWLITSGKLDKEYNEIKPVDTKKSLRYNFNILEVNIL